MTNKLGKKHFQYVGTEGIERLKRERSHRNPNTILFNTYRVQLLLTITNYQDVLWNPQNNNQLGISKRLKPSKQKLYNKLEKYSNRI